MVAMKGVMPYTTPFFMASIRLIPAGMVVLIVAAILNRPQPQSWRAWAWIGLFAIVDGTLFQGFLAAGLVRTTAGLGSVMIDSQPLAVAVLSAWLFKEQIGAIGICGLILGVLGISCIGLPVEWLSQFIASPFTSEFNLTGLLNRGEWLMLLAALSMCRHHLNSVYHQTCRSSDCDGLAHDYRRDTTGNWFILFRVKSMDSGHWI